MRRFAKAALLAGALGLAFSGGASAQSDKQLTILASVPGLTFRPVVMSRGGRRDSCPTSDSAVSAKAAPTAATYAAEKAGRSSA